MSVQGVIERYRSAIAPINQIRMLHFDYLSVQYRSTDMMDSHNAGARMRVFLSHSSKDKGFVDAVAGLLKPGTFDQDSKQSSLLYGGATCFACFFPRIP